MDRKLMRAGLLLLLLALAGGLAVPAFRVPRLALAAHVAGLLGGVVLLALGGFRSAFVLGPRAGAVLRWGWLYAAYANWAACLLGAMTGARRMTPLAGAAADPASDVGAVAEGAVAFLLVSLTLAALVASAVGVWGLRGQSPAAPQGGAV